MRRRRARDVVRVRVPDELPPLFQVTGPYGGRFASLLYGFGTSVNVPMLALRKLLAGSRGQVIVARRLTRTELAELNAHEKTFTKADRQGGLEGCPLTLREIEKATLRLVALKMSERLPRAAKQLGSDAFITAAEKPYRATGGVS